MTQQKMKLLNDMVEDCAVLHNQFIREAGHMKQLHSLLLGMQNALESGAYDDLTYEEFEQLIFQDITDIEKTW